MRLRKKDRETYIHDKKDRLTHRSLLTQGYRGCRKDSTSIKIAKKRAIGNQDIKVLISTKKIGI
jgi:hypothetical protein